MPKLLWKRAFIIAGGAIAAAILYIFFLWSPAPEWDPSAQKPIISMVVVWTEIDSNYIPDVQIWGNGDIVWVVHNSDRYRKVLEGHLSQQEMKQIIQKLIGLGFFRRFDFFNSTGGGDELTVTLRDASSANVVDPRNQELYEFANYLRSGAGTHGVELIPTAGILMLWEAKETEYNESTSQYLKSTPNGHWPDEKFGYGLDSLLNKDNIEISGDELKFAWDMVNNNPRPLVESNGKVYWLSVILPRISGYMNTP